MSKKENFTAYSHAFEKQSRGGEINNKGEAGNNQELKQVKMGVKSLSRPERMGHCGHEGIIGKVHLLQEEQKQVVSV